MTEEQKQEIQELKKRIRALKKRAKQDEKKEPSLVERICTHISHQLEYKRTDPDGYETDQLVRRIEKVLVCAELKVAAGKPLRPTTIEALMNGFIALQQIRELKLGKRLSDLASLMVRTNQVLTLNQGG